MLTPRQVAMSALLMFVVAEILFQPTVISAQSVVYVCVHKDSGQMRFLGSSGECRKTEEKIALNLQGPAGPAGPPGRGGSQFVVVDSLDQEVGIAIGAGNYALRQIGTEWVYFLVEPTGIPQANASPGEIGRVSYSYELPDCAGTAYLGVSGMFSYGSQVGTEIIYAVGPMSVRTIRSFAFYQGATLLQCRNDEDAPSLAVGTVERSVLPAFVPPLTVKLVQE